MQIMTMAMVEDRWASFAWDMKRRQITIHDAGNRVEKWDSHDKVAKIVNTAFRTCIAAFFDGWNIDWQNWATVYMSSPSIDKHIIERLALPQEPQHLCTQHNSIIHPV
jgi:hypothetical protein